jgi:DNA-binding NtrC family response regulator
MARKINLLVIDDDVNQCKTLKSILDKKGYQTYIATGSAEALRLVKEKELDLVIIDLIIKGDKNGVEIFKDMKKIKPDIKAVLFTGYGPQEEMRLLHEALLEGMLDEILRKPIWPDELIKAVEKHTGANKMDKKTSVLVLDDDIDFRKTLFKILIAKGYEVLEAESGFQAIDLLKKMAFDVILIDIKMPAMDGVQAYKRLKEIRPGTAVIMMTAFAVDDLITEAVKEGAYAILRKPLDMDEVIKIIDEVSKKKTQ